MEQTANRLNTVINNFLNGKAHLIHWGNVVDLGKWTNKEIIGHLIDSANVNLQRFVRCTYEEGFKLVYQQDEWVAAQHYKQADITNLLKLWELLNRQIIRVLLNYPESRKLIKCDNGRYEPSFHTVEFLANDYIEHLVHHLGQLK